MVVETEREKGPSDFINILHGDLLLHANALDDFTRGLELPSWQRSYLVTYNSNSLNSPNVTDWEEAINGRDNYGFHVVSPNSKHHVVLITHTRALFRGIHWEQMRLFLGGEEGMQVPNPQQAILPSELTSYLEAAQKQGVFSLGTQPSEIDLSPDVISLVLSLRESGFTPGENWNRYQEVEFHQRFRDKLLDANTYKLGCYLAVMDHATFEAQAEGRPVGADYVPIDRRWDTLDHYYEAKYGKPYPSMEELYRNSHDLFVRLLGNKQDPLIDHVIRQTTLPHLA